MKFWRPKILWIILVALLGGTGFIQWEKGIVVDSDLFSALPVLDRDIISHAAESKYREGFSRQIVFMLSAADWDILKGAVETFSKNLTDSGYYSKIDDRIDELRFKKLWNFYYPRQKKILSDELIEKINAGRSALIKQKALMQLYSPMGMSGALLGPDPFGILGKFLSNGQSLSRVSVRNGRYVVDQDGVHHVFIFAETKDWSHFPFQRAVVSQVDKLERHHLAPIGVNLARAGMLFYMNWGAEKGIEEMSTIGVFSVIAILILLLIVYRSMSPVLASIFLVGFSAVSAFSITHMFFGKIHLMTLVIGMSLIGIVVDYSFHFFCQQFSEKVSDAQEAFKGIKKALFLSCISTIVGYAVFLLTPFPVLKQLAVFSIAGIGTAFLIVSVLFSRLKISPLSTNVNLEKIFEHLNVWSKMRNKSWILVGTTLLVMGVGLSLLCQFDDNVKILQPVSKDLRAQEQKIKDVLGVHRSGRYFLLREKNIESLLEEEEKLSLALGLRAGVQRLSHWIPSKKHQLKSEQAFKALLPQYQDFYRMIEMKPGEVDKWMNRHRANSLKISFSDAFNKIAGLPVSSQWLGQFGSYYYSIVTFDDLGEMDVKALENETVFLVDHARAISEVLKKLRIEITKALFLIVVFLFGLLSFLFGMKKALGVLGPPLLSAVFAFAFSNLLVGYVNLFTLLGLVLIFSLGLDYSFFYAERGKREIVPTGVAITTSVITTILSFGLLALSETGAIATFGITVALGMGFCYFFAPMAGRVHL